MNTSRYDFRAAHESAKTITAAYLDIYETATRAVTELEWMLARRAAYEPVGSCAEACAEMTRDTTAVALSTARWILDL
jgi:hypothetical protein